ncbi:fibrinogen C domain-containing protein 1-A-like [Patiria miniata]|uniref:Fibrinogen C-terminal domain-containing protein n=1 Tax=Patiria miniata TaxID=46514 RepID=A0A914AFL9_PATMI|nr:fibrinogen C domain-containing protein 1-A-like [Patiria miniata]
MIPTPLVGFLVICVEIHLTSARVCYLGSEPDPQRESKLRWVLRSASDPCECTSTVPGGLSNPKIALPAIHQFPNSELVLFSTNKTEIRERLNCPESTVGVRAPDCEVLYEAGERMNGAYTIYPSQYPEGLRVYCDMDNEGWIVFQRRVDGSVNFTHSWADYRDGFGGLMGEFWLGKEALHRLTDNPGQTWSLRMDLRNDVGSTGRGVYQNFNIGANTYELHLGYSYSLLNIANQVSISGQKGHPFSTYDQDNDESMANCAQQERGGWWFSTCSGSKKNLNGEYQTSIQRGIGYGTAATGRKIVWCEMKTRRV